MKALCSPVDLLVFGLLVFSANTRRSADSSSEFTLISSGVFSLGSTTGCSTTTLCEFGVHQRGLLLKVEAFMESSATRLRCLDTEKMKSVARRLCGDVGNCPTGSQTCTLSFFQLFSTMETLLFSIHGSSRFLRIITKRRHCW